MKKPEVMPLAGPKSLRALNAYMALLFGVKMTADYGHLHFEEFLSQLKARSEQDVENMIRKAVMLVPLDEEDTAALVCFCKDPNGVPYSSANIKSLGPEEFFEVIVAVCVEVSKIKIDFVTAKEKKN